MHSQNTQTREYHEAELDDRLQLEIPEDIARKDC
jgi:hypothetical protein